MIPPAFHCTHSLPATLCHRRAQVGRYLEDDKRMQLVNNVKTGKLNICKLCMHRSHPKTLDTAMGTQDFWVHSLGEVTLEQLRIGASTGAAERSAAVAWPEACGAACVAPVACSCRLTRLAQISTIITQEGTFMGDPT